MYRRDFVISTLACVAELSAASSVLAQKKAIEPDLAALAEGKGLKVFNRSLSVLNDGARKGVHLSESPGDGVAYLEGVEFTNGAIEFDIRGKDVQQQSFVGVVFHGLDEKTYDAVYFRPFNFKAEDPARRLRAVQYVSHPTYTWQKLRTEQPGKYEKPVNPVPDPNGWFHARIVVASPKVSVFVNDAKEPSLVVEQLSDRKKGLVGLWVGNTSGGDFANFKIVPA
ncbi:MAG TPA: family 16 glycoside hydrolase [Blastocatellia bacterium]|nr:family 16 glycoside hydrolase [Blastocatellia bacterium]